MKTSKIHSSVGPRKVRSLANFDTAEDFAAMDDLPGIGIGLDSEKVRDMAMHMGMDAIQGQVLTGSLGVPVQFLQTWLPGFVAITTAPQLIDEAIGIQTVGAFEDEELIQNILEMTGRAQPYGDYNNVPLSSFTNNFERRTNVRFEEGMRVGFLENLRYGRVNIDAATTKRNAATLALNILRNSIGFNGYNAANARTYGLLNDPNLPAYVTVPNGAAASPLWANKTYLEIVADIRSFFEGVRISSKGLINPSKDQMTFMLGINSVGYLSTVSTFGNSVQEWLDTTYKNVRILAVPEFVGANGGLNVAYVYADVVGPNTEDASTDDRRTFAQLVPAKFLMIGSDKEIKAYVEDFGMATAGVLLKRPYAVYRATGM